MRILLFNARFIRMLLQSFPIEISPLHYRVLNCEFTHEVEVDLKERHRHGALVQL